ncbi:MAG: CBS domain-containing protein [Planctomycetes bacterium]|nr:CBS domain-containing protein [Planctomycetota bacterium]
MGQQHVSNPGDEAALRSFMKALLADVRALEGMLETDVFETGVRRIGAEQEIFLIDDACRPKNMVLDMLPKLPPVGFTTELAQFNLETNLTPHEFGGDCMRRMETELKERLLQARTVAESLGGGIVMCGILPTLQKSHLGLDSMTPNPRYRRLNDAMSALRGGQFTFLIKGIDELETSHDNVMLESCTTSFQIHFQVAPKEFARLYNLAQAITAPVLAAAVNSPILLGRRLWHETRIALFQQSVDARSQSHQNRGIRPRVSFGDGWIKESVMEIFRDDIARFRVLLADKTDEDPEKVLSRGEIPKLSSLRLHNGTVYRWNRACYGIHEGKAHLRIEARVLPAGPTVIDEMANAAFFFGLMVALAEEYGDIREVMTFDIAKDNFTSAARSGLRAQFTWIGGTSYTAQALILEHLLPLARQGLEHRGIDRGDIDRYLGVLEERVRTGRTGAQWMLDSLAAMQGKGTQDQRLRALCHVTRERQKQGDPVARWKLATIEDTGSWRHSYQKVGQFMTTDLFTVHPTDVVDLAASLMDWRHIRHVPVEDAEGRLVGLVSHRSLLRLVGQGATGVDQQVLVQDIMKKAVVTVTPDTPTLEAIEKMRGLRVGSLPVVEGDKLVGIITERDLINVAAALLEQHLKEQGAP